LEVRLKARFKKSALQDTAQQFCPGVFLPVVRDFGANSAARVRGNALNRVRRARRANCARRGSGKYEKLNQAEA
jgi:hypothetical protein